MRMQYPVKMILPTNYPMAPPKIYFDFQLPVDVVRQIGYIGEQNALTLPYNQQWNYQYSNLLQMAQQLVMMVQQRPPVA